MRFRHFSNHHLWLWALALALSPACAPTKQESAEVWADDGDAQEDLLGGTIAYPFVSETAHLGEQTPQDKLVIRSASGDSEVAIEIPDAARDYDVQVPLASLGEKDPNVLSGQKPKHLASPVATDQELVGSLPRLDRERPTDSAMLDKAFAVGNADGPQQSPSYTLGIAKVNQLFKAHQYEYALIEVSNLLSFFPNSPQLHKMKGTLLLKMHNLPLAEAAWIKALDLEPNDAALRKAISKLQQRMVAGGRPKDGGGHASGPPPPSPTPVGVSAPASEPGLMPLAH